MIFMVGDVVKFKPGPIRQRGEWGEQVKYNRLAGTRGRVSRILGNKGVYEVVSFYNQRFEAQESELVLVWSDREKEPEKGSGEVGAGEMPLVDDSGGDQMLLF